MYGRLISRKVMYKDIIRIPSCVWVTLSIWTPLIFMLRYFWAVILGLTCPNHSNRLFIKYMTKDVSGTSLRRKPIRQTGCRTSPDERLYPHRPSAIPTLQICYLSPHSILLDQDSSPPRPSHNQPRVAFRHSRPPWACAIPCVPPPYVRRLNELRCFLPNEGLRLASPAALKSAAAYRMHGLPAPQSPSPPLSFFLLPSTPPSALALAAREASP